MIRLPPTYEGGRDDAAPRHHDSRLVRATLESEERGHDRSVARSAWPGPWTADTGQSPAPGSRRVQSAVSTVSTGVSGFADHRRTNGARGQPCRAALSGEGQAYG